MIRPSWPWPLAARLRRVFAAPERLRPRRRETTLTVGWIAHRLQLGTRKSVAVKLNRRGDGKQQVEPDQGKTLVDPYDFATYHTAKLPLCAAHSRLADPFTANL